MKTKAATALEIITYVAIVSIVAAVFLPALMKMKQKTDEIVTSEVNIGGCQYIIWKDCIIHKGNCTNH